MGLKILWLISQWTKDDAHQNVYGAAVAEISKHATQGRVRRAGGSSCGGGVGVSKESLGLVTCC